MPMWDVNKSKTSDGEVVYRTDGYAICPVCHSNDDVDHFGDEPNNVSVWECVNEAAHPEAGKLVFSVYDKHSDYRQTYRDDHFDFYYIHDEWEYFLV